MSVSLNVRVSNPSPAEYRHKSSGAPRLRPRHLARRAAEADKRLKVGAAAAAHRPHGYASAEVRMPTTVILLVQKTSENFLVR